MRRQRLVWAAAAAGVVLVVLAIGPGTAGGPPLDPRSTGPAGVRGVLDVLRELGVQVEIAGGVSGDAAVALVITDRMTDEQREDLREWARGGGLLVVADPLSPLAPDLGGLTSIGFTEPTIEPMCEDPAASGVERVAIADGVVFSLPDGATGCFPRSGGWWMVRQPLGDGGQVTLGGAFTLTNELLDDADTAVFLVSLLSPEQDGGVLQVITGDEPAGGGESLADVLPDQVGLALAQVPLAWLALVWWRGRRHGHPVGEDPPVALEAAETTVALGNLLQRAGHAASAAARIRASLAEDLRTRLGLAATGPEDLAATAAERTGQAPADLRALLVDPPPTDDAGLVAFAHRAAALRQAITTDAPRHPTDPATHADPHPEPHQ